MNYLLTAGGFLLGYVFGSIPCGLWLVQAFHGIDIRKYGSGNIGTTNVFRTVGPKTAAAVLAGDMMKGILALHIISKFSADPVIVAVAALGALLGHNYSLFLGFKGGKGVATGLGLFLYMLPWGAAAGLCVWIIIVLITRYVSLGSVIAAIVAASAGWYLNYPVPFAVFGTLACLFVIIRHKDNIKRLLNGTESKIKPGHLNDNK